MPTINRFRIVNFKFDDNKKYIADEIFEMDSHNTLLNLENGGGKSTILQLALQVMLPNTPLGTRKMSDYFNLNSGTVHILMEWCLDFSGLSQQYLLTGFCCQKGQDGLNYFTYLHQYTGGDEYDIKDLPVLSNKREVTGYHEFYRYIQSLSRESGLRFNVFRQNDQKKYRVQLASYNLFDEEFRAIRTINQSEGGIEKFFEKTRSSRQVIERLIIPSIPAGNEEESSVLAESLRKHMDNLKMIPELQNRIKKYDEFCKKAANFLQCIKQYAKINDSHKEIAANILEFENLLIIAQKITERRAEEALAKKEQAELKFEDIVFKNQCFDYSKNYHEEREQTERLSQINREIEEFKSALVELRMEHNNCLSVNDWMEMKEEKRKLLVKKAELNVVLVDREEWNKKYQRILATLEFVYLKELEILKKGIQNYYEEYKRLGQEIKTQAELDEKSSDEIRRIENNIYYFDKDLVRLNKELNQIVSQIGDSLSLLLEPQNSLIDLESEISSIKKDIDNLKDSIEGNIEQIKSVETEIIRKNILLAENRKDKDSMEKELSNIKNEREVLEKRVKNFEIGSSIYQDKIDNKLYSLIEKQRAEYNRLLSSKLTLENKQFAFTDEGGYIPDYAIKRLVDFLNENDIFVVPGSIWLSNQNDELRKALMDRNPYLPYSVITNEKNIRSIERLYDQILSCIDGFPVWILTTGGEAIKYPGEMEEMDTNHLARTVEKGLYFINNEAAEFSIDQEKFQEYVQELKERISQSNNSVRIKQNELSALEKLYNDIHDFTEKYPETLVSKKEEALKGKKVENGNNQRLLDMLKQQQESLKDKIEEQTNDLELKEEHQVGTLSQMELIKRYIMKTEDINQCEKKRTGLKETYLTIRKQCDLIKKRLSELDKLEVNLKNKMGSLEREKEKINNRLRDVKGNMEAGFVKLSKDMNLEELEAKKSSLERDLDDLNVDYVRELIENYQKNVARCEENILSRGSDRNWLESINEVVPKSRIEELAKEIKNEDNTITGKNVLKIEVDKKITYLRSQMNLKAENIEKQYKREPQIFDRISAEEEQRLKSGINAVERNLQRETNKLKTVKEKLTRLISIIERVSDFVAEKELRLLTTRSETEGFYMGELRIDRWNISSISDEEIKSFFNQIRDSLKRSEEKLNREKDNIHTEFSSLYNDIELKINQNINGLLTRVGEVDIYNYEIINQIFQDVFNAIQNLKEAAQMRLDNLERDRKEMVIRCVRKAMAVYDEVKNVDRFSKITIAGVKQRAIRIKAPAIYEEHTENMMGQYLDRCISELTIHRSKDDFDPAKIEDEIRKRMKPTCLLDAIAPLNSFRIEICKPGHNLETSRYIEWEKIIVWSGGEKLAGFFAMFIAIVSYLRYKRTNWLVSKKVIWIDNPFGQANAGYLLDYIFELAKTTNTQMICLTGLQETSIYEKFDVVYSLVHRMLDSSKSVIRSDKVKADTGMDSGLYKVNHTQMNLFEI